MQRRCITVLIWACMCLGQNKAHRICVGNLILSYFTSILMCQFVPMFENVGRLRKSRLFVGLEPYW